MVVWSSLKTSSAAIIRLEPIFRTRLRDPSHVAALSVRASLEHFTEACLELERLSTGYIIQTVKHWLEVAHTPSNDAAEVSRLILEDASRVF